MLDKTQYKAFRLRGDEPRYALIPVVQAPVTNRYGKPIELVDEHDTLAGQSLNINGDSAIGSNPNRYKQHGFYFNADNCIACHACESACSEKNNLSPHLAFRSVGYVEGGTWPAYQRLNISMACNHCDDPVCLKGCPTRAYTKFAEYGAVLQDPDICFGCGYCTWVCPYNAPQLDPVNGQVEKCNMCVDRLEAGLKPACASACLAGALDFGVIETTPENRAQLATSIPGFPDPEITHPNIRFQQTRSLPRELTRPDSIPLRYERDAQGKGNYRARVREQGEPRQWNLRKLLTSHENAHIAFTLSFQAVLGAFLLLMFAPAVGLSGVKPLESSTAWLSLMSVMFALLGFGLLKLNLHLGKPQRFYRGFNNLRWSPVSREIAGVSLFFAGFCGYAIFSCFDHSVTRVLAQLAAATGVIGGLAGLYYMYKLYRIPARPFWHHWQTATAFLGTTLSLGALLIAVVSASVPGINTVAGLLQQLAWVIAAGLALEGTGHVFHARDLRAQGGEGAASHYEQTTRYGNSYLLRNVLLGVSLAAAVAIGLSGWPGAIAGGLLALSIMSVSIIGRALFYVLVIPTTMPGAFFWRNRGFQQHARDIGLADMPQVGVK